MCYAAALIRPLLAVLALLLPGGALPGGGPVHAATYALPEGEDAVVGALQTHEAVHEDTFVALARRYDVGFRELELANPGVDPWLPGAGTRLTIPTRHVLPDAPRSGIVLNVPEMRLYYYPPVSGDEPPQVMTFPVSVGRQDWSTPYGLTRITRKQREPAWYPPESIREEHAADGRPLPRVVPPGPDNPLGSHALRLALPGYLIHGTNRPAGVGMRVTHGCIRMFPDDIARLFDLVDAGEAVRLVNQPYKMGWLDGALFLEVHPPLEEDVALAERGLTALVEVFVGITGDEEGWVVDWRRLEQAWQAASGMPVEVPLQRRDDTGKDAVTAGASREQTGQPPSGR